MRSALRRSIALSGLTAVVVISGSIATADGTRVSDVTSRALATAPAPAELSDAGPAAPRTNVARATASTPPREGRTAEQPGWLAHASWYGPGFQGERTANGERYDQLAMTAAHKTLPFGTQLRVTNVANGRSVVVRINDRGPFVEGRDLDLSRAAAESLGYAGVATVRVQEL